MGTAREFEEACSFHIAPMMMVNRRGSSAWTKVENSTSAGVLVQLWSGLTLGCG